MSSRGRNAASQAAGWRQVQGSAEDGGAGSRRGCCAAACTCVCGCGYTAVAGPSASSAVDARVEAPGRLIGRQGEARFAGRGGGGHWKDG